MEVCNEKEEKYFVWINIGIGEEMGYFRNKLNRILKNINELKKQSGNWVLLTMEHSPYNIYGNASKDDLPISVETYDLNENRYDNDFDAQHTRQTFEEGGKG